MSRQAVILLGGRGTRLSALYPDRPKALVPVAGRPFIEWQMDFLHRGGIRNIHLAAGHMADAIEAWAGGQNDVGLTVSREPSPLGTAGAIKFVEPHLRSDPFLVINGDTLLPNANFQSLEKCHADFSNAWITILVAHMSESGRYGTVEFGADGTINAFREKASRSEGWINAGIYLVSKKVLQTIEPGRNVSIETDVFPALAEKKLLRACPCEGPLLDMGTPEGWTAMNDHLSRHPAG